MSLYLSNDRLFEFLVALIMRNNGYITGVPRRLLGGRGTKHKINVIALDVNNNPFSLQTVLIPVIKPPELINDDADLQLVRNLKATILDLEQTLPSNNQLVRDIAGIGRGDLFHRIYGSHKDQETLTVKYTGSIFTENGFADCARQFANAYGIYVVTIPERLGHQPTIYWLDQLRSALSRVLNDDGELTLPGLLRKSKKIPSFKKILENLQSKNYVMEPLAYHDLFTILNEVIKEEQFLPLTKHLQHLSLATVNGYPVLLDYNLSYKYLIDAALSCYEQKIRRVRTINQVSKYKPLDVIPIKIIDFDLPGDGQTIHFNYSVQPDLVPEIIYNLSGSAYIPLSIIDHRCTGFQVKMPLKAGLSLIYGFILPEGKTLKELLADRNIS